MSLAQTLFYDDVENAINRALAISALIIEFVSFIHCLVQRAGAFSAIHTLSKGTWLAMTGGAFLATLVFSPLGIFGLIAIAVAGVYLLDVRPALRDATNGRGIW